MARPKTNGKRDNEIQQILDVLLEYRHEHARCRIDARRRSPVSIRIRVIDPDFEGTSRSDREPVIWRLLKKLPEDVFLNITMLLLLTPEEAATSLANREFEDPIPARL